MDKKIEPNLFLRSEKNRQSWIFRYTRKGKIYNLGIGSATHISLPEVKTKVAKIKEEIINGTYGMGLSEQKNKFKTVFEEYLKIRYQNNTIKEVQSIRSLIEREVLSVIGEKSINKITKSDILDILKSGWYERPLRGNRIRSILQNFFDFAKVMGYLENEFNPASWKNNLEFILPPAGKIHKISHAKSMNYCKLPELFKVLQQDKSKISNFLQFLICSCLRGNEVLSLQKSNILLDRKICIIPASKMKNRQDHKLPLSEFTLSLLDLENSDEIIFKGVSRFKAVRILRLHTKNDHLALHGFRSAFRDWASENTGYSTDTIEYSLSHYPTNKTVSAYARSDLLNLRKCLMHDWQFFLLSLC